MRAVVVSVRVTRETCPEALTEGATAFQILQVSPFTGVEDHAGETVKVLVLNDSIIRVSGFPPESYFVMRQPRSAPEPYEGASSMTMVVEVDPVSTPYA